MAGLSGDDEELWSAWKRATESVHARINADVSSGTGLSEADVSVLTHLQEGERLRQSALGSLMGWHRSRLSHHLTRMADRGLVVRTSVAGGVEVRATTMGRAALLKARPVHADAVRRHLVDGVPPRDRARLLALLRMLSEPR